MACGPLRSNPGYIQLALKVLDRNDLSGAPLPSPTLPGEMLVMALLHPGFLSLLPHLLLLLRGFLFSSRFLFLLLGNGLFFLEAILSGFCLCCFLVLPLLLLLGLYLVFLVK